MSVVMSRRLCVAVLGTTAAAQLTGCTERMAMPPVTHAPRPPPRVPAQDGPAARGPSAAADRPPTSGPSQTGVKSAPPPPRLDLPPRREDAETGSLFLDRCEGLGRSAMDEAVVAAILEGNVPAHQRQLVPVTLSDERGRVAVLHVTCDYLSIGPDEDFVRMPMTSAAAQRICDRLGTSLPTPHLVDVIFSLAPVKLAPSWIDGGPTEGTLADYATHNKKLEARRHRYDLPLGTLVAGHKKDIVLCERMAEHPGKVAIYGWHEREGKVVQPLSTRHSCRYADYSHGIRLVDQHMTIDGVVHRVAEVLADPAFASLLSSEGPLPLTAYSTVLPEYAGEARKRTRRK